MRRLGKVGLYLKSTDVVEKLSQIDTLVFDKTGTITSKSGVSIRFVGENLTDEDLQCVRSLTLQSSHPYSRAISDYIQSNSYTVSEYDELIGRGVVGVCMGKKIRIGSLDFLGKMNLALANISMVGVEIDGFYKGAFLFELKIRDGIDKAIKNLEKKYRVHLLSGDTNQDESLFRNIFGHQMHMKFKADPHHKLEYVKDLQLKNASVAMVGDGLNDAGALLESKVGIAVMDDIYGFSPASDAIIEGEKIALIPAMMKYSKKVMQVVKLSLILSLLYNALGLSFAISGNLSPMIAAILMPLSSTSVVSFVVFGTNFYANKILKK
jgi:Cu+-exporting ATPase